MAEKNEQLDFGRSLWAARQESKYYRDREEKLQSAIKTKDTITIIDLFLDDLSLWKKGLKKFLDYKCGYYGAVADGVMRLSEVFGEDFIRPIFGQYELEELLETQEPKDDYLRYKVILDEFYSKRKDFSKKCLCFERDSWSQYCCEEIDQEIKNLIAVGEQVEQAWNKIKEKLATLSGNKTTKICTSHVKAYQSYKYAEKASGFTKDRDVYDWLLANPQEDYEPNVFETWKTYVSKARTHYGTNKNTRRAGRGARFPKAKDDPELLEQISNQHKK